MLELAQEIYRLFNPQNRIRNFVGHLLGAFAITFILGQNSLEFGQGFGLGAYIFKETNDILENWVHRRPVDWLDTLNDTIAAALGVALATAVLVLT